ncbi:hypothetical protein ACM66B_003160 [Microbotryomycetes sp. NB124-2]
MLSLIVVFSISLLTFLSGVSAQRIDSPPSIVACLPTRLTFGGGTPPYYISIVPAGDVGASPLVTLPPQTGTSYSWPADVEAGSNVTFVIRDSEGILNFSSPVTVQPGPEDACSSMSSASSTSAATSSSASSTIATLSSPTSSTTSTSSSRSETESTSSPSRSAPTPSSSSRASSSVLSSTSSRSSIPAASAQVTGDNNESSASHHKMSAL